MNSRWIQSLSEPGSTKNIIWTPEMDMCLTDELIVQMHKGNKIDRGFTSLAYQLASLELFIKCGATVSVKNVRNRLKTLRKDLAAFQDIQSYCSGFSFNRVTRMMDADPKVWKDYIDAHPKRKGYQHKPVPSFENLLRLCGNVRATGKDDETIKEKRIRLEREKEESNSIASNQECDKEIKHEDEGDLVVSPLIHRQDPELTSTSSKVAYKRKHVATSNGNKDIQILKNETNLFAPDISKCATCAPHLYTAEELFEEVAKLQGLDEGAQLLAYDFLCGDDV